MGVGAVVIVVIVVVERESDELLQGSLQLHQCSILMVDMEAPVGVGAVVIVVIVVVVERERESSSNRAHCSYTNAAYSWSTWRHQWESGQ